MKPNLPEINWKEIFDKYPKAWDLFWSWIISYDEICEHDVEYLENRIQLFGGCEFSEFSHFNRGDLYSFFDENKVFVSVNYDEFLASKFTPLSFGFTYKIKCIFSDHEERSIFMSRKECEQQAFLKAFEILNTYLDGTEKNIDSN